MRDDKKNIFDIITRLQCQELKNIGLVVVHREPLDSMVSAFYADEFGECLVWPNCYHRMVADSINRQNKNIEQRESEIYDE